MSTSRKMTKEELTTLIRSEHATIRDASGALTKIAESIGRTQDFNFSALEDAKKAIESIDGVKAALVAIRNGLVARGRTKIAEECKAFTITKKS